MPGTSNMNPFRDQSGKVRDTMWRIRHVLAERQTAYENSLADFVKQESALVEEFHATYVGAYASEDVEAENKLDRFLYAVYGFPYETGLTPETVNERVVEGLWTAARWRLERYSEGVSELSVAAFGELRDVKEAYKVYLAGSDSGSIESVLDSLVQKREDTGAKVGEPVVRPSKGEEVEMLKDHLKELEASF